MNENYVQPAMPKGAEEGIIRACTPRRTRRKPLTTCNCWAPAPSCAQVEEAAPLLRNDFGIGADVGAVPSFNELRRDSLAVRRWNRLHPGQKPKQSYVEECLGGRRGPVIASTDYMKLYAEQIRQWVPSKEYKVLGTDGCRPQRQPQEAAQLLRSGSSLGGAGRARSAGRSRRYRAEAVAEAIAKYGIDPEKRNPLDC